MKVIVAKTAGFCRGVRDALDVTLEAIQKRQEGEKICTFGPLIHNRQVLAMLEEKGISEENDLENCTGKKVVIRAHGIPPHERQRLRGIDATLLDATCRRVARVHAVIKWHARRGYHTVIVGDADHAEVIGLLGYTEERGRVINRTEQVSELPEDWDEVLLVAQTTQNEEVFEEIQAHFLKRYPQGVVKNTICDSTHQRQAEVRQMCSQVEAMIVVGGYHSGNTLRLADVARDCGAPTYHVETEAELNQQEMARYSCVGVSAGASTPNWIIRNVAQFLESVQPESSNLRVKLKRVLEMLAYANVYVALGAFLLSAAVHALVDIPPLWADGAMAAFYLFAMHSLNIYLDRNAIQLNDPGRFAFYQRWRSTFTKTSIAALVVSLGIAINIGFVTFWVMVLMILLGLIYAVPVILPARWQSLSALKIKDIPTSKTLSVPLAWASVMVIAPHVPILHFNFVQLLYAFWVIFLTVLVRTALLDLLAVRGDRLVGKETLVVLVGEKRTLPFIFGMLALLVFSSFIGPLFGLSTRFAYALLPVAAIYGWQLRLYSRSRLREDPLCETLIESVLIGFGALALLWLGIG
jgi:(E)-4-hydroxy-3-methyl-but-2-enyl pyrophosphate reductase